MAQSQEIKKVTFTRGEIEEMLVREARNRFSAEELVGFSGPEVQLNLFGQDDHVMVEWYKP